LRLKRHCTGYVIVSILFISLSAAQYNLESDWAEAGTEVILCQCSFCVQDSIVGHGRRRKQAHDEHHDWIGIRRGLCNRCGKTFTARSQALQRYFLEGRCWEDAAPTVKDHVAGSKRHEENLNRDLDITPPSMELG
jgi:hypothetical protein